MNPVRVMEIKPRGEYVTLGQALKIAGVIDAGGQARGFLEAGQVLVNGESEDRRGRKLYPSDGITLPDGSQIRIT